MDYTKVVLKAGEWGTKPMEASDCLINITECEDGNLCQIRSVVIGDSENNYKRMLSMCLMTMNVKEIAKFTISNQTTFTVELLRFVLNGTIYEWSAEQKVLLTQKHKEKGVELFKSEKYKDAAYCFTKALKIISSIPIDAENTPDQIDNVPLNEINSIKASLYSNLASFYLKYSKWQMVIDLCNKAFIYNTNHIKTRYKIAMAYMQDRNFEQAKINFEIVLKFEPNNSAARVNLKIVNYELEKARNYSNSIIKKMFQ